MRAIHRKVFRELQEMRSQAIAIALVIVAGVATFVSLTSIYQSVQGTLDQYYSEYRFADGFASVRRAPEAVGRQLRMVPGVNEVQTRVVAAVNLEVPGFDEPVVGTIVSLPPDRQPELNRLHIREGRLVEAGREDEVLLNEVFAQAHGLGPGDALTAIIRGSRRTLTVVGIALSPEFLYQVQPGSVFPDPERYGVLWMERGALAAAYDMEGAFNDVAFTLAPGASVDDVILEVDRILERYGGQGAYPRADQVSHDLVTEDLQQLRGMATLLPVIFLGVAAFLLNIVVTRLIVLQRQMIAILKAFGYRNRDVVLHYLSFMGVIAAAGIVVGILLGVWLGTLLGDLYLEFFRFPELEYVLTLQVVLVAVVLTLGAALVGVLLSVRRVVQLQPAQAMRPAPPESYRPSVVERMGLRGALDQPTRIIVRNVERHPLKSALTVVGISFACALMIMGSFTQDSFDHIVEVQFGIAQREHLTVTFTEPTSTAALHELRSLPGVLHAEPFRMIPVRLRHGHRSHRTSIDAVPEDPYLRRVLDADLRPIPIPEGGMVLARGLADILGVGTGDLLTVEVLEGRRWTREVPVVGVAEQFIGVGAYMTKEAANRLSGSGESISGAYLLIDPGMEEALVGLLRDRPRVAALASTERMIESFWEEWVGVMVLFTLILGIFASVIAFGVIYNSARIALSERDRELATLRVLGFTRGEISYIMLGEVGVLVLLAIPLGLALGAAGSFLTAAAVETELLRIPVVITRGTLALAASIVLASAVVSGLMIRRRLYRLDLIGVLKTRE